MQTMLVDDDGIALIDIKNHDQCNGILKWGLSFQELISDWQN